MKRLFERKAKEQDFWDWFSKNANAYFHFEKNQNVLFTTLKTKLNRINPDLVFEFGPIKDDETRELIISADGIKTAFPIITNLVNQAPTLKNWKFIAFRQPRAEVTQINYQNLLVRFDDIFFRYSKDNGKIGLELNIRGFNDSPEWTPVVFIILDNVLGEYQTEMSLSYINKKKLNEAELGSLFPIRALPGVIEDYQSEFTV